MNKGHRCRDCGKVWDKPKVRTINKVKYDCCHECRGLVDYWTRPENDRPGRCGNCAQSKFKNKILTGALLRVCKVCDETVDTDANMMVIIPGDPAHKWKGGN